MVDKYIFALLQHKTSLVAISQKKCCNITKTKAEGRKTAKRPFSIVE